MRGCSLTAALAVAALAVAAPSRGDAGAFTVSPVRLELSAAKPTGMLIVRNTQDLPLVIQLETVEWGHDGREDTLEPTREILATPPVFMLEPGAEQVVRVALRRSPAPDRELSFRLLVREVPPRATSAPGTLQVALRLSLPVFVAAADGAAPDVLWRLERLGGGLKLVASNRGGAHLQVAKLELAASGRSWSRTAAAYLLPGQRREWLVDEPDAARLASAGRVHLSALTQRGPLGVELDLPGS